jgi:hypothetical protein
LYIAVVIVGFSVVLLIFILIFLVFIIVIIGISRWGQDAGEAQPSKRAFENSGTHVGLSIGVDSRGSAAFRITMRAAVLF